MVVVVVDEVDLDVSSLSSSDLYVPGFSSKHLLISVYKTRNGRRVFLLSGLPSSST